MTETDRAAGATDARRRRLLRLLLAAGLIASAWTAAWAYARTRLIFEIDAGLARLERSGVRIVCPERTVGGWPFGYEVACRDPGIEIPARGVGGSVATLRVAARIFAPWTIVVTAEGPGVGEQAGAGRLAATWRTLTATLHWRPGRVERATLSVEGIDATVGAADGRVVHTKAEHFEAQATATGERAQDLELALASAAASLEIDGRRVGPQRSDLSVSARLVDALPPGPGEAARAFATRGGKVDPVRASFSVGGVRILGKGALRLGEDGLLDGSVDFAAEGLEAVVRDAAALGPETTSLLAGFVLLGKPSHDPDLPGRRLDLVVDHGRPRFGRLMLPPIAPLFRP